MIVGRLAEAGRLGELDVARDLGSEDLVAVVLIKLGDDLHGEQESAVEHRDENTRDRKLGVVHSLDAVDGYHELRETLERVELALHRNYDTVARGKRVDGEHSERGRAVDEDVVVVILNALKALLDAEFGLVDVKKLEFCACERGICGDNVEIFVGSLLNDLLDGNFTRQKLLGGSLESFFGNSDAAGRVTLGVKVDDKYPESKDTERRRDVNTGGGLTDAALLVSKRNDLSSPKRYQKMKMKKLLSLTYISSKDKNPV